jgi:hypothetical protein
LIANGFNLRLEVGLQILEHFIHSLGNCEHSLKMLVKSRCNMDVKSLKLCFVFLRNLIGNQLFSTYVRLES